MKSRTSAHSDHLTDVFTFNQDFQVCHTPTMTIDLNKCLSRSDWNADGGTERVLRAVCQEPEANMYINSAPPNCQEQRLKINI